MYEWGSTILWFGITALNFLIRHPCPQILMQQCLMTSAELEAFYSAYKKGDKLKPFGLIPNDVILDNGLC